MCILRKLLDAIKSFLLYSAWVLHNGLCQEALVMVVIFFCLIFVFHSSVWYLSSLNPWAGHILVFHTARRVQGLNQVCQDWRHFLANYLSNEAFFLHRAHSNLARWKWNKTGFSWMHTVPEQKSNINKKMTTKGTSTFPYWRQLDDPYFLPGYHITLHQF